MATNFASFRAALAAFLGPELYRKFVQQGVGFRDGTARMRYWQEREWERFIRTHPEWALTPAELAEALNICWLHGRELVPTTARVVGPGAHVDYTTEFDEARRASFPRSRLDVPDRLGLPTELATVYTCPVCDEAYAAWVARP